MNSVTICSFPTKSFIVDDNENFLNNLKLLLDLSEYSYIFCVNPHNAATLINQYKQYSNFMDKTASMEVSDDDRLSIDFNIKNLHKEIYSTNRFNQVSTLITDYDMPGINGLELCQRAKNKILTRALLTGVADENTAIDAFNKGLIEQYIRKQDKNVIENIKLLINNSKKQYFYNFSKNYINLLYRNDSNLSILLDTKFIDFFSRLIKQEKIVEYYLLDHFGSFLMLKSDGSASVLYIIPSEQIDAMYNFAEFENCPQNILKDIKHKAKTLYFSESVQDKIKQYIDWNRYIISLEPLDNKQDYYYSYSANVPFIDQKKIISFDSFKEKFTK